MEPRVYLRVAWFPALAAMALVAAQAGEKRFAGLMAAQVLLALAAFAGGGVLGLLFGVPRAPTSSAADGDPASTPQIGYRGNTNLEQISDWLTKILVGAGLTQLANFEVWMRTLGDFLAPAMGTPPPPGATPLAVALVVYFAIAGFVGLYLWTRVHLPRAFGHAETAIEKSAREKLETAPTPPPDDTDSPETERQSVESAADGTSASDLEAVLKAIKTTGAPNFQARHFRKLGTLLKKEGLYEEAVTNYVKAAELDPSDPVPLNLAGVTLARDLKRYADADALYQRALSISPTYTAVVYNLACLEARRGNNDAALTYLTRAIAKNPVYKRKAVEQPLDAFAGLKDDANFRALVAPESPDSPTT